MKEQKKYKKIGRYKIESVIGRGATGVVYKAYDPIIERLVAIKAIEISKSIPIDEYDEYIARFYREAQAAGRLSHPNVVTIYDVSSDKNTGIPFIVMEFIDGHDLNYFLNKGMMFSLDDVLNIMDQIADALEYAHQNNIVHRDIKCSNILLQKEMKVKVVDFGIAKTLTSNLTKEGQFLGTPNYMSPEQIQGLPIDHRSDIYSLGVVFYRLLTGERPFQADSFAGISYKILNEQPAPPKYINPLLPMFCDQIIAKMLAKDPLKRYQSAKTFREDIWRLQSQDYSSNKAIGAKVEYKYHLKNIIAKIKNYKLTLAAVIILMLILSIFYVIKLNKAENTIPIPNQEIQRNNAEAALMQKNNEGKDQESFLDAEFKKYKQLSINFYNNNNYSKAVINIAKALSIRNNDVELMNYLVKSINEVSKGKLKCTEKDKNNLLINIEIQQMEAGFIIIEQNENICFIAKTNNEITHSKIFIQPTISTLNIFYFNGPENSLLSSSVNIEQVKDISYNLQLTIDKNAKQLKADIKSN